MEQTGRFNRNFKFVPLGIDKTKFPIRNFSTKGNNIVSNPQIPPSSIKHDHVPTELGHHTEKAIATRHIEVQPPYPVAPGWQDGVGQPAGIDFNQLLSLVMRRWLLMVITLLVTLSIAFVVTWNTRRIYQAESTVLLNLSSNKSSDDMPLLADLMGASQTRSLETQVEILKSGSVAEGALKRLKAEERVGVSEYLDVAVTPVRGTNIVSVQVKSYYPQAAAAFANAVSAEYISQSQDKNRQQVRAAMTYVEDQVKKVETRLTKARTDLRHFKEVNNTIDLAAEASHRVDQLGQVEAALADVRSSKAADIAQITGLRAMATKLPETEKVPASIVRRPAAEAVKAEITKLELEKIQARETFTANSTKVKGIEGRIAALRQQLKKEAETEVAEWQPNPLRAQVTQNISKLQSEIWATEARENALIQSAQTAKAAMATMPAKEQQLGQLAMDVATQQRTYEMLSEKYQNLRISEQAQLANAQSLSAARVPGAPISPNKRRNLMSAFFVGLILAFMLAAFVDRMDDRVHSDVDAEQIIRLPVLAHIPFLKDKESHYLLEKAEQKSFLQESFQMLRTNISFSELDETIRSIVVTSTLPGEGKSTCSVNLAIAAALSGEEVILVDCDLRRPSIHRIFGLDGKVGLSNVVSGQMTLDEALQKTEIPGLRVLTAGVIPPNPLLLLKSAAAQTVLRQIQEQAAFTVLDVPPALALADALVVSTVADAVVLVVSCDEVGKREVVRTRDLLAQTGTLLIGVVLNKISTGFGGGYYGYGYGGYYGYRYKAYDAYLNPQAENSNGAASKEIESAATPSAQNNKHI